MQKDRKNKKFLNRIVITDKDKIFFHYQQNFSNFVLKIRGELTQQELATALSKYTPSNREIKQTSIASYENCKTLPNIDTLYAISRYSGISSDKILDIIFKV
jgi:transcriptional regulator with XRE-family HTH domain